MVWGAIAAVAASALASRSSRKGAKKAAEQQKAGIDEARRVTAEQTAAAQRYLAPFGAGEDTTALDAEIAALQSQIAASQSAPGGAGGQTYSTPWGTFTLSGTAIGGADRLPALQAQLKTLQDKRAAVRPGIASRALSLSDFIANPRSQFDYLKSNPLFQMSLDNANRVTQQSAAARGRLSAGDTLQQLSNNVLLSAQPLVRNQTSDIFNLLQTGQQGAISQANAALGLGSALAGLATDRGNVGAAEQVAVTNAKKDVIPQVLGAISSLYSGAGSLVGSGAGSPNTLGSGSATPGGFGAGAGGSLLPFIRN